MGDRSFIPEPINVRAPTVTTLTPMPSPRHLKMNALRESIQTGEHSILEHRERRAAIEKDTEAMKRREDAISLKEADLQTKLSEIQAIRDQLEEDQKVVEKMREPLQAKRSRLENEQKAMQETEDKLRSDKGKLRILEIPHPVRE